MGPRHTARRLGSDSWPTWPNPKRVLLSLRPYKGYDGKVPNYRAIKSALHHPKCGNLHSLCCTTFFVHQTHMYTISTSYKNQKLPHRASGKTTWPWHIHSCVWVYWPYPDYCSSASLAHWGHVLLPYIRGKVHLKQLLSESSSLGGGEDTQLLSSMNRIHYVDCNCRKIIKYWE